MTEVIKKIYKERKKDERINWGNISYKDIEEFTHINTFFDSEGFLFHLPAYMIFILKYHNEEKSTNAEENFIFSLTPFEKYQGLFYDQIELINNAQKETIILFLN